MNWEPLLHCALYGFLGIVLVTIGFKIFDAVLTKIDIEQEVAKGNIAAAILGATAIAVMGTIVAIAIH